MQICLDYGHNLQGADTGAQWNGYKEEVLTREVGKRVKNILEENGHRVIESIADGKVFNSVQDSLYARYSTSNNNSIGLFVSVHFNASNGQGHGTEVYTYNSKEVPQARQILNNIVGLGYTNRGIKDGSNLAVIKNTKATAVLVECCFIDNKEDMNKYNADKMAEAIAYGVMGKTIPQEAKATLTDFKVTKISEKEFEMRATANSTNSPTFEFWISELGKNEWSRLYKHSPQGTQKLKIDKPGKYRILVYARDIKSSNALDSEMYADIEVVEDLKAEMLKIRADLDNLIAKM